MKNLLSSAQGCNREAFVLPQMNRYLLIFCSIVTMAFIFAGCKKEGATQPAEEILNSNAQHSDATVLENYTGLSTRTMWELQQARAATERYRHLENAIKDGYKDIAVVVQEMGHHFMKADNVDAQFDYRKPEILVYNKEEDGGFALVAVEYAVPIQLSPNTAPSGFSGNNDVWDKNLGFKLWLLHAWVWSFNPNGVFNPTNPLVHTH